ncbi:MAG: PAS domain S-box protein [Planctomycetes bacterium]|nr:PAS domain S-box protein [Planctomycetota bacterium]
MDEKRHAEGSQTKRRTTFQWYRLYYLLAALNLITIAASLFLGHRMLSIYTESVTTNQAWAERLVQFSQIAELMTGVNAPGNDVFTSLDAKAESVRLDQAVARYRKFVENIRGDIRSNGNPPDAAQLLARLDRLNTTVVRIEDEAKRVFDSISNGQTDKAAKQMSVMDRHFGQTISETTGLIQNVGSIQQKRFARQMARARQLDRFETVFAGCAVLILCGLTSYGYLLAKRMTAAETDLIKATQAATDANRSKDDLLLELRSSETRLKTMLASSMDPLLTINGRGIVQAASDSVEAAFGWTPQELIGQNVKVLMPEPYRCEHDGHLAQYRRTGVSHLMGKPRELSAVRRDGTVIPAVVTIWRVDLPGESEPVYMGIIRDITERKRSEAKLDSLNKQLLDAAHRAGKAEIATGVLHNVGNVLNSVNVSAGIVQDKVRESGVASLTRAADLMEQHLDDLGAFITQDERGKKLPPFLINLSRHMSDENEMILEEITSLISNIDHIKTIVATQQSYASGISGVMEEVSLAALLEDAININVASMKRHSVKIIRQFDDVAPFLVDKQKLLQIVVNLISNAKYACLESSKERDQMTVTVSLQCTGEDYVSTSGELTFQGNVKGASSESRTITVLVNGDIYDEQLGLQVDRFGYHDPKSLVT